MLRMTKHKLAEIKNDYKEKVEYYKYWDKIERKFIRNRKYEFTMAFPNMKYCNDEFKIEYIAHKYGYMVIYENITSDKSIYVFRNINN